MSSNFKVTFNTKTENSIVTNIIEINRGNSVVTIKYSNNKKKRDKYNNPILEIHLDDNFKSNIWLPYFSKNSLLGIKVGEKFLGNLINPNFIYIYTNNEKEAENLKKYLISQQFEVKIFTTKKGEGYIRIKVYKL